MAFDEKLAERLRRELAEREGVSERKMFGGLAFMVRGHMCCGIVGTDLVVRVGPVAWEEALARPHARPMDFTGRPMRGMIYVGPAGLRTRTALARWISDGLAFVDSLPEKKVTRKQRPPRVWRARR